MDQRQGSRHGCRLKRVVALIGGAALLSLGGSIAGAQDLLESTRRVSSPDAKRAVAVEWAIPVSTGEAVDFSGRMQVRISDIGGTTTRQRQIDAPQVRSVQTPLWLDERWAAFTYNIQKNFNGIVYLDTADGTALQVEMVAPVRRMGATGRTEAELTSLDVIEHNTTGTIPYRNITRGRASVFPLVLKSFPQYEGQPFSRSFLEELRTAVESYRAWLAVHGAADLHLEAGSETFSPDERHVALLACLRDAQAQPETTGPASALLIIPLEAASAGEALASARLVRLDSSVSLSCATAGTFEGDAHSNLVMAEIVRYTTRWQDGRTVAVDREISDEEREEIKSEPVYLATLDGVTTRLPAADHAPVPVALAMEPDEGEAQLEAESEESTRTGAARPAKRRVSDRSADRRPRRSPAVTPAAGPIPGEPRRRIPTISTPGAPAPYVRPPTPTPYTAEPIPNLLNRFGGLPWRGQDPAPAADPPAGGARPDGGNSRR